MRIVFYLTQLVVFLLVQNVSAQRYRIKGVGYVAPWEIGLSTGISSFLTSVAPNSGLNPNRINYWNNNGNPGVALSVVRNFSPSIGIELNWLYTRLSGRWDNKWPQIPEYADHQNPLTYNSLINQFDLMVAFNVNQILMPGDAEDIWHLYLKTGIGMTRINDKKNFYPGDSPCNRLSFAVDAGISVSVSEKAKLMLGSTFRTVNTDNLDGVHVFSTDQEGKPVAVMNVFEIYNFTYLRINYSWGNF